MCNIIPFYAYPRSGATLFSTILNMHSDIIVTPEMYDVLSPNQPHNWREFIAYFNKNLTAPLKKILLFWNLINFF